jgi:hypothetical protein
VQRVLGWQPAAAVDTQLAKLAQAPDFSVR